MFFTSKKSTAALLLVITLSWLQQFMVAAQQVTGTATSAPPPVPTFVNTPGISVQSPGNGMTIRPDGNLPIVFSLGRRTVSAVVVTMAKADGSGNTTVLDLKPGSTLRFFSSSPLTLFKFPVGDYIVNMVITPNLTATVPGIVNPPSSSSSAPGAAPTTTATASKPTVAINLPGVYYWRGAIKLSNDTPAPGGANGNGASNNAVAGGGVIGGVAGVMSAWTIFVNMMAALAILAFVNVVAL
ncbi:hypothetical protein BGX33_008018 [Mortierella sp. NVP41]|nr:hypothetical protein BGX33_008018 [Mortierella sp. NVP41]